MITVKVTGNYDKIEKAIDKIRNYKPSILDKFGRDGVAALSAATPQDTGKTASSWDYKVESKRGSAKLTWFNTNYEYGAPVAILIQYGHGLQNGSYVQGIDYINPAIKPILEKLAKDLYEEVRNIWVR